MFRFLSKAMSRSVRAPRPAVLKARFSSNFPHWPTALQTPHGDGRWKDVQFHVDQPVDECDVWFVYEGLSRTETTLCPPDNVVFITAEPPIIKDYNARWLRQFARVISCQRNLRHPAVLFSQTAVPWHVGKSYDALSQQPFPPKSKSWSAIASNKSFVPGHRLRLAFIEELRRRGGGDIFGRGTRELAVKWDGLADYRYSVAIENCQYPDYWTEKIADCFLAGTVPFYFGCPNILDFFPAEALVWLDVEQPEKAIRRMDEVLGSNDYEQRLPALEKAKSLVLNEYNMFNFMAEFCKQLDFGGRRRRIQLKPEPS
jgi:hypothetical protein